MKQKPVQKNTLKRGMRLVPVILLLAACAAPAAFAAAPPFKVPAAWRLFATDASEGAEDAFHYFDSSKVEKVSDSRFRVWEIVVYSATEEIYARHEVLWELDGAGKSARQVKSVAVLRDGSRIVTTPSAGPEIPLTAGSPLKTIWEQVSAV